MPCILLTHGSAAQAWPVDPRCRELHSKPAAILRCVCRHCLASTSHDTALRLWDLSMLHEGSEEDERPQQQVRAPSCPLPAEFDLP